MEGGIETRRGEWHVSRRTFLKAAGTALAVGAAPVFGESGGLLRFGLITDLHYADTDMKLNRFFRESLGKLRECVDRMNEEGVAFLCELGDFKDEDPEPSEARTLSYLEAIEAEYARFNGPRHYVFGNHDLDSISKDQFLARTAMTSPYYSFDAGNCHFVVLDACFDENGIPYDHGNIPWHNTNVPPEELEWLRADLADVDRPTIVFAHQRLDGQEALFVNNAPEVRAILEASGNVRAVFTGHDHAGGLSTINGIHYYTLIAAVEGSGAESNSYALVEVNDAGDIVITGYRRAVTGELPSARV